MGAAAGVPKKAPTLCALAPVAGGRGAAAVPNLELPIEAPIGPLGNPDVEANGSGPELPQFAPPPNGTLLPMEG